MAKKSFSENLRNLFGMHQQPDESFFEDLEDTLVEGDLGARTAYAIVEELRTVCRSRNLSGRDQITAALTDLLSPWAQEYHFEIPDGKVSLIMVFGVNGVGKTTTVAKMASHFISKGVSPIVLAAADTFRAAAIEQLQHHGDKTGCRVIAHQHGADPSAVVYSAVDAVRSTGEGWLSPIPPAASITRKTSFVSFRRLTGPDRDGQTAGAIKRFWYSMPRPA